MLHTYMFFNRIAQKLKSEEGAGMAEYTLLLVLVALGLIAVFGLLRDEIDAALDRVIAALQTN